MIRSCWAVLVLPVASELALLVVERPKVGPQ